MDCSRAIYEQDLKKVANPLKIVAVFEPSENSCQFSEEKRHSSEKKNGLYFHEDERCKPRNWIPVGWIPVYDESRDKRPGQGSRDKRPVLGVSPDHGAACLIDSDARRTRNESTGGGT